MYFEKKFNLELKGYQQGNIVWKIKEEVDGSKGQEGKFGVQNAQMEDYVVFKVEDEVQIQKEMVCNAKFRFYQLYDQMKLGLCYLGLGKYHHLMFE